MWDMTHSMMLDPRQPILLGARMCYLPHACVGGIHFANV